MDRLAIYSANIKDILYQQIGRQPRGKVEVAVSCSKQLPMVIVSEFLVDGQPFPTVFWLTCPLLVSLVHQLEGNGEAKRISRLISQNIDLSDELYLAWKNQVRQRQRNLNPSQITKYQKAVYAGIDGSQDRYYIKCLHAHLADFLATNKNPVGKMVWQLVSESFSCSKRCCE